jgi:transposase
LLLRQGLTAPRCADLFGARGRQWLTTVTVDGWAGDSFRGLYDLYQTIDAQLAPLEHTVRRQAADDPIARALDRIPGIGPVLGLMIRAELGAITRFHHPAQLASYAGLVPRVTQSGSKRVPGPITKDGSPWLRWALIEAATHGLGRPDAVGRWARQLAMRKGALKTRAAIARRLCEEIFRTWSAVEQLSGSAVETPMTTRVVAL